MHRLPRSDPTLQPLSDLEPALEEAFSEKLSNRLVFLDVVVDPGEHVYPMAVAGGSMKDMYLGKGVLS